MQMLPDQWQERLERHFKSLKSTRAGTGFPVFTLEHGLNDTDIEEISSLLQIQRPRSQYWLLWVVHATERGYTYIGDEYWPPFEEQTPLWKFKDRHKLTLWFRRFQTEYDGVVPSGRWAKHFTIISWPVTHAILPKYLQRQFARALYDLRYSLVEMEMLATDKIGQILAANASGASARFKEFLQQEELTGRIVLAFLDVASIEGKEPIYKPTLQRIVEDLERVRSSREWLRDTRRIVRDRFRGIGTGQPRSGQIAQLGRSGTFHSDMRIRPRLMLSHRGGGNWSVLMEVPSFRNIAVSNVDFQSFLKKTRCRLNGATDFKPGGWLLSGRRIGILKSWPDSRKPLIEFESSDAQIDHLLAFDCYITSGPIWLFRIASDGSAREIMGGVVRPGCRYIVATSGELPEPHSCMNPCHTNCTGIQTFSLSIPQNVSAEDTKWLDNFGLQVARTIRVWPAGLPGRGWDGDGNGEWLTTEAPCLGIMHDHPVDAYSFSLDNGTETIVNAGRMGQPMFVRIAPLPVGTYTMTVKAQRSTRLNEIASTPPAEGFIQIQVREPEPWIPGVISYYGLVPTIDPLDADLDSFWKNEVNLSVIGPESHSVTFSVSLQDREGHEIVSEQICGPMKLPVMLETWRRSFSKFLKRIEEENVWCNLEAGSGQLNIEGGELGQYSFRFEHEVLALRWVLRRDRDNIIVRLIDDTGHEGASSEVLFFSMEHPLKAKRYSFEKALSGIVVEPPGGLYQARQGDFCDTAIVSALRKTDGLQGLKNTSDYTELYDRSVGLETCLRLYASWCNTRLYGPLVETRLKQIKKGCMSVFFKMLCGKKWALAETEFVNAPDSQAALDSLQRAVEKKTIGFAAELCREHVRMAGNLTQVSKWYATLAARFHVSTNQRLCDFAIRLVCEADRVPMKFGSELKGLLNLIRNNPAILRGARFTTLLYTKTKRKE